MVGIDVLTKCPYCKKVYPQELSITTYYKHKDKIVRIEHHCDKDFITTDTEGINISRYSIPAYFRRLFLSDIIRIIYENLTDNMSEEKVNEIVFDGLKKNHSDDEISEYKNEIKTVIEIAVGQINIDAMYSEPLTKDMRDKLKWNNTTCW